MRLAGEAAAAWHAAHPECREAAAEASYQKYRAERADFAGRSGWPVDLPPSRTAALNLLAAAGVPSTRYDLAQALAISAETAHTALTDLKRRGLVIVFTDSAPQSGRGRRRVLYALSPLALSILKEHAQCKSNDETPR
jgi:DNA-binding MarR family transcriptional regulator